LILEISISFWAFISAFAAFFFSFDFSLILEISISFWAFISAILDSAVSNCLNCDVAQFLCYLDHL